MIILPEDCRRLFEPVHLLATGGFGAAVLCNQLSLERQAVVKVLHADGMASKEQVDRFKAEATITSRLQHPNIVRILDFGYGVGVPWIAYEYIEGRTVHSLIEDGAFSPGEVLELGRQIACALDHAHRLDILHRDIKGANVLRAGDGSYKVIDFGIAQWSSNSAVKTATGIIYGSPEAMPPEYIGSGTFVPASDIYSLGVLLFQASTGRLPFTANNPSHLLRLHLTQVPPALRDLDPSIPVPLDRLVARLLAKTPEARFPGCRELIEALEALAAGATTTSPSEVPCRPSLKVRASGRLSGATPTITRQQSVRTSLEPDPGTTSAANATRPRHRGPLLLGGLMAVAVAGAMAFHLVGPGRTGETVGISPAPASAGLAVAFLPGTRVMSITWIGPGETTVTWTKKSGERLGEKLLPADGKLEIPDVPADTDLVLEASGPGGDSRGRIALRTPPALRLGRIRVFPEDRRVLVDFDSEGPPGVEVRLRRADGRGEEQLATRPGVDPVFRHWFEALEPGTDYVLDIRHPNAMGGSRGPGFKTQPSDRERPLQQYLKLRSAGRSLELVHFLTQAGDSPDPGLIDVVRHYLAVGERDEISDDEILGFLRFFREKALAEKLIPDPGKRLIPDDGGSSSSFLRDSGFLQGSRHSLFDPAKHLPGRIGTLLDDLHGKRLDRVLDFCDPGGSPALHDRIASWCEEPEPHSWKDRVVEAMARIDPRRAGERFRRWLGEKRADLRARALFGLGLIGEPADVTNIMRAVAGTQADEGHAAAVEGLVRHRSSRAREALLELLPRVPARRMLIWTCARSDLRDFMEHLVDWLGLETGSRNSSTDGWGLGTVVEPLVPTMDGDRVASILSLGMIASPDAMRTLRLERFLKDHRLFLAQAAAWTLGFRGSTAAGPGIVEHLLERDGSGIAIWAVGELRTPEAREPLTRLVAGLDGKTSDPDQSRLGLACWALGRLGVKAPDELLTRVGKNPANQSYVQQFAKEALAGEETRPGERRFFLFPMVAFLRTGIRLPAEESVRVEVLGKWGVPGKRFQSIAVDAETSSGLPLRGALIRGRQVTALRELASDKGWRPDPFLSGESELILSPWQTEIYDTTKWTAEELGGFVQVRLTRVVE